MLMNIKQFFNLFGTTSNYILAIHFNTIILYMLYWIFKCVFSRLIHIKVPIKTFSFDDASELSNNCTVTTCIIFNYEFSFCRLNSILTDNYTDSSNNTTFDYGFEGQNIGRLFNNCSDIRGPCFQTHHPQDGERAQQTYFIYLRVIEILYNFQEKYFYVFSAIGIFGNLLICTAIMRNTKLQNSPNCYILNLAAADILSLAFSCILQSFKVSG